MVSDDFTLNKRSVHPLDELNSYLSLTASVVSAAD